MNHQKNFSHEEELIDLESKKRLLEKKLDNVSKKKFKKMLLSYILLIPLALVPLILGAYLIPVAYFAIISFGFLFIIYGVEVTIFYKSNKVKKPLIESIEKLEKTIEELKKKIQEDRLKAKVEGLSDDKKKVLKLVIEDFGIKDILECASPSDIMNIIYSDAEEITKKGEYGSTFGIGEKK